MPLPSGTWSIATIEVVLRDGEIYILQATYLTLESQMTFFGVV